MTFFLLCDNFAVAMCCGFGKIGQERKASLSMLSDIQTYCEHV